MSDHTFEIVKIIIDKGLLGLFILGATFLINRFLEKYRARNTYTQKLSEARIEALQDLSKILSMNVFRVARMSTMYLTSVGYNSGKSEDYEAELNVAYQEYKDALFIDEPVLFKYNIFCSDKLHDAVFDHQQKIQQLVNLIKNPHIHDDPKAIAEVMKGEISRSLATVQVLLQDEINKNPF